jgi:predicted small lipoprotein YifL
MVPPAHAQVPFLPLTDTEIIVYFFNSLCRPIVSLRLYARGWGPAAISDCINSHRNIVPAYLRNTCSVKCTTAIKKGIDRYGEGWDIVNRAIFQSPDMTDDKATDLMKMRDDEFPHISDFDLRDLCDGLQKHPDEEDGGIFTRCVKYCQENNSPYFLSNVWELAQDLVAGRLPKGPRYLAPQDQNTAEQSTQRARREGSDDSVIGNEAESISRTSL